MSIKTYKVKAKEIPPDSAFMLCKTADQARNFMMQWAEAAGVSVPDTIYFNGDPNLHTYDDMYYIYVPKNPNPDNLDFSNFLTSKNYLMGLSDAAQAFGYTLCYNSASKNHELVPNR